LVPALIAKTPALTFNLSDISQIIWTSWLRRKKATSLAAVAVLMLAAAVVAYRAEGAIVSGNYLYPGRADLLITAFFAGFAGVLYWGSHFQSKTATGVAVSSEGIEVRYPTFRALALQWTDRSFRLNIRQVHFPGIDNHLALCEFWWKPRLYMREEVADAIVTAARSAGMLVQTVKDPGSISGESVRIRSPGPSATRSVPLRPSR
jgi:hypothetical protein